MAKKQTINGEIAFMVTNDPLSAMVFYAGVQHLKDLTDEELVEAFGGLWNAIAIRNKVHSVCDTLDSVTQRG